MPHLSMYISETNVFLKDILLYEEACLLDKQIPMLKTAEHHDFMSGFVSFLPPEEDDPDFSLPTLTWRPGNLLVHQ